MTKFCISSRNTIKTMERLTGITTELTVAGQFPHTVK